MLRWSGPDAWLGAVQQPGTEKVCGPAQATERGRAVQVQPHRTSALTCSTCAHEPHPRNTVKTSGCQECLDGVFAFYRTRTASEGLQKAASASAEAARATSERLRQQASQVLVPLCTLLVGPPCCRLHQLHLTDFILARTCPCQQKPLPLDMVCPVPRSSTGCSASHLRSAYFCWFS